MSATATVAALPPASSTHETLIRLCMEKRWQAVIDHVRIHPSDAKITVGGVSDDVLAMPPLHIACQSGAPIQVVKALLNANPHACQISCGTQGRLPLHLLLATAGAMSPSATPLQENVVIALVEAYPGGCRVVDRAGNLPIHLACVASRVSDAIFTSILSMHPEGAYARNHAGMYPLHLAASNKDLVTKRVALAALDRGTIYASISKMTTIRLSKEHEAQMKSLEERKADMLRKVEAKGMDEISKLKTVIDGMTNQLREQVEINRDLREGMKVSDARREEELALAVQKERAVASDMERRLRSELAEVRTTSSTRGARPGRLLMIVDFSPSLPFFPHRLPHSYTSCGINSQVQLRNMDFLDQIEAVQSDLCASNERVEKQGNDIVVLERRMDETVKILTNTTDELSSKSEELQQIQKELVSIQTTSEDKSKYILHLEASLLDVRACVLDFINQQERMELAMHAQKEAMSALMLTHDTAMNDMGSLGKNMLQVVSKIEMSVGKDEEALLDF
jgi:hypothetical protein